MTRSNGNWQHGFQNNLVKQSLQDLQSIVWFVARDNPRIAESFGYILMSKVDVLSQFPQLGRVVPEENDPSVREIIFGSYRILYKVLEDKKVVAIARIWQGARGQPDLTAN